jgi:hypothetical protein
MATVTIPQLWTAFELEDVSQINFDPIIVAVYCFITRDVVTPEHVLKNGKSWFPERAVKTSKGEAARLRRFAEKHPEVFAFDDGPEEQICLLPTAFENKAAHECDAHIFDLALYRLGRSRIAQEVESSLTTVSFTSETHTPTETEVRCGKTPFLVLIFFTAKRVPQGY